ADSLEAATSMMEPFFLDSLFNASDVLRSGTLSMGQCGRGQPDQYVYDPRDTSGAQLESTLDLNILDPQHRTDQRMIYCSSKRQLIYHSLPFEEDTEVTGFFRLSLWISIDQPDTDFSASIHEVLIDGSSIPLSADILRARYRLNLREEKLIDTIAPLQ